MYSLSPLFWLHLSSLLYFNYLLYSGSSCLDQVPPSSHWLTITAGLTSCIVNRLTLVYLCFCLTVAVSCSTCWAICNQPCVGPVHYETLLMYQRQYCPLIKTVRYKGWRSKSARTLVECWKTPNLDNVFFLFFHKFFYIY